MKGLGLIIFIFSCITTFAQQVIPAEREKLGAIQIGGEGTNVSYSSSEEGFLAPEGPFVDSDGALIFYPSTTRDRMIVFHGKWNVYPLYNYFKGCTGNSIFFSSQQGYVAVGNEQFVPLKNGKDYSLYPDKEMKLPVTYQYFNYVMPFGSIMESIRPSFLYSTENIGNVSQVVRNLEETRNWLPSQPGGFSIGDDGLLYRNGMLWSAQIPKGGSYAYEYIGRLMSGHQVWVGGGVGSYIRYVTISNSARQIELILDIPWAPDPADDSRGFNPYNYGLGPWGELYCLIPPPPVDVTTYYTPQPGLPAELVVVRNHLKYFGRLNDGGVRLRKEPNTTSDIVGTYQNKTGFRIIEKGTKEETIGGQKNVWYKVRLLDGTEGWFFGSFVHNLYDGPSSNPPPWPNVPDW